MSPHLLLAFAAASLVIGAIPGPGVTAIVGYALGSGRKTALASVAGMALGNATCMTLSLAGVGAILAASAVAFTALKWIGAVYLVGLGGWTLWRARRLGEETPASSTIIRPRTAFLSNVMVGTFHPKTIVFFVAFAPQFIEAHGSYWLQGSILVFTFCGVVALTDSAYAVAAARAAGMLRRPKARLWSRRASGGVLVAAGIATAAANR